MPTGEGPGCICTDQPGFQCDAMSTQRGMALQNKMEHAPGSPSSTTSPMVQNLMIVNPRNIIAWMT